MRRRNLLTAAGVAALAGCASSGDENEDPEAEDTSQDEEQEQQTDDGQESEPSQEEDDKYITASADELLPDEVGDDWPDQELERDDEFSQEDGRLFVTPDEDMVIFVDAINRASAEGAEEAMQRFRAELTNVDEYSLADQAIIGETNEVARLYFREANALCQVGAARQSVNGLELVPDRGKAIEYAEIMFERWENMDISTS